MIKKESSMAAASGDPFYVFKDELESKVSAVNQKHAKWRAVLEAKDSPAAKELPALTHQIEGAVAAADKSVKFLEETIVMVEANRAKFEHIDAVLERVLIGSRAGWAGAHGVLCTGWWQAEIASRKAFVATTRKVGARGGSGALRGTRWQLTGCWCVWRRPAGAASGFGRDFDGCGQGSDPQGRTQGGEVAA
ncbi:hypothetical protein ON010_g11020 [Phytophthora cinnamomi]|nr:hypothetical protein ON010_g11020 [Phytophthora cinnamomi]